MTKQKSKMEERQNHEKPGWLQQLEQESWQAELIISGLALYGTFQLPDVFRWLTNYLLTSLPISQYLAGYSIAFAFLLGISILTTFFIIHFILRAYWIGMIGLNSVYPKGIDDQNEGLYSPLLIRKFKKDLPPLLDSIKNIDTICSTLFSGAFAFLMLYGMGSLTILLCLLIYNVLLDYIPSWILIIPLYLFGVFFLFLTTLAVIAQIKKYRYNQRIQHLYFKVSRVAGIILSTFFYKPIYQIIYTFSSNYKKGKSNLMLSISFGFIALCYTFFLANNSNLFYLVKKGVDKTIYYPKESIHNNFYLDKMDVDQKILTPVLDGDIIEGPYFRLFIPIFENEMDTQMTFCDPYVKDPDLSHQANRRKDAARKLECYERSHQILINDSLYHFDFYKRNHKRDDQFGIEGLIPREQLPSGKNILKINKLMNPSGEVRESFTFPFWVASS